MSSKEEEEEKRVALLIEIARGMTMRGELPPTMKGDCPPPAIRNGCPRGQGRCLYLVSPRPFDLLSDLIFELERPGIYRSKEGVIALDAWTRSDDNKISPQTGLGKQVLVMPSGEAVLFRHTCCVYCERETALKYKVCSGCKVARYCSDKCSQNGWPEHKPKCAGLKAKQERELRKLEGRTLVGEFESPFVAVEKREECPFPECPCLVVNRKWVYHNHPAAPCECYDSTQEQVQAEKVFKLY